MKWKTLALQFSRRVMVGLGIAALAAVCWSLTASVLTMPTSAPRQFAMGSGISASTPAPLASATPSQDVTSTAAETPPLQVIVPAPIIAEAEGPWGAQVDFLASASASAVVTCAPAPRSIFPIGGTLVICTAKDQYGNTSSKSTGVTVQDTLPASVTLISIDPKSSCYGPFECPDFVVQVRVTDAMPIRNVYLNYKFTCADQECFTPTPMPLPTPTVVWPSKSGWTNRLAELQKTGAAAGNWVVRIPVSEAAFLGKSNGYLTLELFAVAEDGMVGTLNPPDRPLVGYKITATPAAP